MNGNGMNGGVGGQSFEQEFIRKVRSGAAGAKGGAASGGVARGKLDWKVLAALGLGGLILIGWVVWMVVSSSGGGGIATTGRWVCDDESTAVIEEDREVLWSTAMGRYSGIYNVEGAEVVFGSEGSMIGVVSGSALEISDPTLIVDADDGKISCRREE